MWMPVLQALPPHDGTHLEHDDDVGVSHGGQAVRYDDRRAARAQPGHRALDVMLRKAVQRGRRLQARGRSEGGGRLAVAVGTVRERLSPLHSTSKAFAKHSQPPSLGPSWLASAHSSRAYAVALLLTQTACHHAKLQTPRP